MAADGGEVNALNTLSTRPHHAEGPAGPGLVVPTVVILAMAAVVEDVMHAMADVAAGGGDGVAAFAPEVGGLMACRAPRLHYGVAYPAARIPGGLGRIGENGPREGEGGEDENEDFHGDS